MAILISNRSSGTVLLSYLDSILGLKTGGVDQLEQRLALATSKRLNIVDMSQNCGAVGIGVAQLIPDCNVVVLDSLEAESIIEHNIKTMFPALGSTVKFSDRAQADTVEFSHGSKSVDLLFVTSLPGITDAGSAELKTLGSVLARFPGVVAVVVEEGGAAGSSAILEMLSKQFGEPRGEVMFHTSTVERYKHCISVYKAKSTGRRSLARQE
jgi:hypothetical protein